MSAFIYRGRVAFHETDAARIVHFSNYLRYAEEAELYALESIGFIAMMTQRELILPRVHVSVDYMAPLHFWEGYELRASVAKIGASSLTWSFEVYGEHGLCARVSWVTARIDTEGQKVFYVDSERAALASLML